MATRANIIIKDNLNTLYYYKDDNGCPVDTLPLLVKFMQAVIGGKLQDNASQSAGWLTVFGYYEISPITRLQTRFYRWRVGSIEPTTALHGDIDYCYTLNLDHKEIIVKKFDSDEDKLITVSTLNSDQILSHKTLSEAFFELVS